MTNVAAVVSESFCPRRATDVTSTLRRSSTLRLVSSSFFGVVCAAAETDASRSATRM